MHAKIHSISIIGIAKFFILIFILYIFWFFEAISESRFVLYGTAIASTLFILIDMKMTGRNLDAGVYSIIPLLFVYGVYSLLSGIVVSTDREYFVSSMITYFAFMIMCYNVCYISNSEQSIDWLIDMMYFVALICTIQTVFWGKTVRSSHFWVTTMGEKNNPNSLGLVMLIGIFAALNRNNYQKRFLFSILSSIVFLYVIVLCGSRKCLIGAVGLIFLWLFLAFFQDTSKNVFKRLSKIILILGGVAVVVFYLQHYFGATAAFERFQNIEIGSSYNGRLLLYKRALDLWLANPFFGVGYNQYVVVSGTEVYTHSTYAEILACTGIFGVVIWIGYFFRMVKTLIQDIRQSKKTPMFYRKLMNLIMLLIEMFIGLGQIWFYEIPHLFVLTFIFGFAYVENQSRLCSYYED